jgi:hypothetical protein
MSDAPITSAALALTGQDAPQDAPQSVSRDAQVTPFSAGISQSDLAATRAYLASLPPVKGFPAFDLKAFDEAARADGLDPTPQGVDANGAAIRAAADDYKPAWSSELVKNNTPESLIAIQAQTGEFAASLKFDSGLGVAVIEHMADLGPKLNAMSLDDKVEWRAQQERQLAKRHGDAGAAAMKARVSNYLANNPTALGKELSKATVLSSAWLLETLHNQITNGLGGK